ncbi:MAG: glycosyltransferase, partial [Deltaproteobacteria bacterium]|nr:glycosyltransferase [Deltaproteobacteria bacterium]
NRVILFPNFPADEKLRLYKAADFYISMVDNFQETFGINIIEAMASGLPIIASDFSGYRELVKDGKTGFLIPTLWAEELPEFIMGNIGILDPSVTRLYFSQTIAIDLPMLEKKMMALYQNEDLRNQMGRAGAEASHTYRWKNIIRSYEVFWDELSKEAEISKSAVSNTGQKLLTGDFSTTFSHYPSKTITGDNRITITDVGHKVLNNEFNLIRYQDVAKCLNPELEKFILNRLAQGDKTVKDLREEVSGQLNGSANQIDFHLIWLIKHGAIAIVEASIQKTNKELLSEIISEQIQLGEELFLKGKIKEALYSFESALKIDPDNVSALNNKGAALNRLGDYQGAIESFTKVIRIDTSNNDAIYNLISNYIAMTDWANAEMTLEKYGHLMSPEDIRIIADKIEQMATFNAAKNNPIVCLICGSPKLLKKGINISFGTKILECKDCGFVHTEYVSESALQEYYSRFYRENLTDHDLEEIKGKSCQQAASQIEYLNSIVNDMAFSRVLDYGTADGELAKLLKNYSSSIYITEVDPRYRRFLTNDKDLTLLEESDLEGSRFNNFFDLITISHVLEHIPDPINIINIFSRILKKDGLLLVDIPNELEIHERTGFQAKGHLSLFTVSSFKNLIKIHGKFDILDIRTCNHSVDDFIESGFNIPEQYFRQSTPNGTVIRTLLCNSHPDAPFDRQKNGFIDSSTLLDTYSCRILEMHQQIQSLKEQIDKTSNTVSRGHINRFENFLNKIKNSTYPEPPLEPHISITKKMIDYVN